MIDQSDFNSSESQINFDFKGFLIKTLSYWKWFLLSWAIAFTWAYQVNIRKEKIYAVDTTISVKEESNPFFTANTSLVFNWGGTSDQVQTIISLLKSRSHNELVVDELEFYTQYLEQGKYNKIDVYGSAPFTVNIDKDKPQLADREIKIKFVDASSYVLTIPFETNTAGAYLYSNKSRTDVAVPQGTFVRRYRIGSKVVLPFLSWTLDITDMSGKQLGKEYLVSFSNFDGVVGSYQGVSAEPDAKGGSILKLSLQGHNKARMVDYLNTTVRILKETQLAAKNQFATNTINFIDSTMRAMEESLRKTTDELKSFSRDKNVTALEQGGESISMKLTELDSEKDRIQRKIAYLNNLSSYLKKSVDYSKLPSPSVVGIEDPNIVVSVSKLITLSTRRAQMQFSVKSEKLYSDFDVEISAIKNVLLENVMSARSGLNYDLNLVNAKLNSAESELKQIPEDKQDYLKIQRKFDLGNEIYTTFLQKRTEANIVKAANVSDIRFIDNAKDVGGGLIGPKTSVNYILALFLGFIIPLLGVFGLFFVNNSIQNTDDVAKLTSIPLIGVIGKKKTESNLSVFERPKSALSESFRAIRSSLQFLYKRQNLAGAKTLMITSSISGEGKTFCSINIATVFALSEKKTIIVGLDLRKPKLFNDFKVSNDVGAVDYLVGLKSLDEVIQKTSISHLDVIPSGPNPPNPAELIMSDAMTTMLQELKSRYDYIILDTPPVGLVSDALELSPLADVTLYVVRQNFTKKDMITLLNNRQKRGELSNVSIVLNGFESKAKYGYGYGYNYGYGYGYGNYSSGYHEDDKPEGVFAWIQNLIKLIKSKIKK